MTMTTKQKSTTEEEYVTHGVCLDIELDTITQETSTRTLVVTMDGNGFELSMRRVNDDR